MTPSRPVLVPLIVVGVLAAQDAPDRGDVGAAILQAERLLAANDAAAAASTIADAIARLRPEGESSRAAHWTWARALIENGRFGDAAPVILRSLGLDAAATPALALAARGSAERGDRRVARALLRIAVHLDPGRGDLLVASGTLSLEDGDAPAALEDAAGALARAPADTAAAVLRARALHALGRAGDARDALAALDRVHALAPDLLLVFARLDLEAGLPAVAEAAFGRLGRLGPDDAAALARAWIDAGDPRRALDALARAQDASALVHVRLRAAAHLELGAPREAADLLAALPDPSVADRVARARAEALAGDLDAAAAVLEGCLERDPAEPLARAELARVSLLRGDARAARRHLAAGLAFAPHHPALVRALEDVVPELAPPQATSPVAILRGGTLQVSGTAIPADPASALRRLRALRLERGPSAATLRLVVDGPVEGAVLARTLDLLAAAGFARIAIESR